MIGRALSGDVTIAYEEFGSREDPALVLVAGLGNQMQFFEDEFVQGLTDRAFRVVRFDNRDTGLSTTFDDVTLDLNDVLAAADRGAPIELPYSVLDMAHDVVALLDHLEIERAHLLGTSLGGMICQDVAIHFPDRVTSLGLLSSTSGASDVGQPSQEALTALLTPNTETDRTAVVERDVETRRIWATPEHFDEQWTREFFEAAYDRSHHPGSSARQLAAVVVAPGREAALQQVSTPTLVMHGTEDKLIGSDGGARLADLIPGAEFLELEGMGHDLPPHYWAPIIEAVTLLAIRAG